MTTAQEILDSLGEEVQLDDQTEAEVVQEDEAEAIVADEADQEAVEEIVLEDTEEAKARESGWKPKDEFTGDGWVDAGEFNRRAELFDKIGSQNKTIKALQKQIEAVINHNKTVAQKTRERTIAELEQERINAIEYGDSKKFQEAEQKIKAISEEKDDLDLTESEEPDIPSYVSDFAARNSWFEKDEDMTDLMLVKTQRFIQQGSSHKDAIEKAEAAVKKQFAKPAQKPPQVTSGKTPSKAKGKSINDLTKEQQQVWEVLKLTMDEKEFLEQI